MKRFIGFLRDNYREILPWAAFFWVCMVIILVFFVYGDQSTAPEFLYNQF